jgi:methylenetetrahydrofolate reductase (NADPH)
MKVIDHINNAKSTLFSFELLPPLKGHTLQTIFDTIDPLMEFNPSYINITYHREEVVYRTDASGQQHPRVLRRRPGTVGIAASIQHRYNIDVVPHIICGGFTRGDTEDALIDLDFLGIQNVLVVRGDADKITGRFEPRPGGHRYAVDLVKQIMDMNRGVYQDETLEKPNPTNFCVGVAGYPEKHAEAPNLKSDIQRLKEKVDAGADYVVTQMFFDNTKYFEFVARCREVGINVPIIPGLKPLSLKEHLYILPKVFNVQLPEELVAEMEKCQKNADVRELGIDWAIQQAQELKRQGVPALHFYTMGKSDNIARIAKRLF